MIDCKILYVGVRVCVCREEKTEQLMDSKHEVERLDQELQRLKQEVRTCSLPAVFDLKNQWKEMGGGRQIGVHD